MKSMIPASLLFASFVASAAPIAVSEVEWSQDEMSHLVTVSYTLASDAIVTVEVITNGVPMKGITHLHGDVCKWVEKGERSFAWAVECSHPDIASLPEDSEVRVLAWKKSDPPDYLVASLAVTNDLAWYPDEASLPFGIDSDHYRTDALVLRRIHAKNRTWRMGGYANEDGVNKWSDEYPHLVTLTRDYYIGVFEVTQGQNRSVNRYGGGCFVVGDAKMWLMRPRDSISYNAIRGTDAGSKWPNDDYDIAHGVDPTSLMQKFRDVTGLLYLDLPTEAQWEYACRAGTTSSLYSGMDVTPNGTSLPDKCNRLAKLARYSHNGGKYAASDTHSSTGGTARVGSYMPNAWGLYDMLGNIREWCLDYVGPYPQNAVVDPVGQATGAKRIHRGGGYPDAAYICRVGNRGNTAPTTSEVQHGFRLAMDILPESAEKEDNEEVE
jgi:formylglycine-generating enzyme required for sulfatase activity